jgi:hypothetical protein
MGDGGAELAGIVECDSGFEAWIVDCRHELSPSVLGHIMIGLFRLNCVLSAA